MAQIIFGLRLNIANKEVHLSTGTQRNEKIKLLLNYVLCTHTLMLLAKCGISKSRNIMSYDEYYDLEHNEEY